MGDCETVTLVVVESLLKYHSDRIEHLTLAHDLGWGQCLVGSLTGAVASQNVTEAPKGSLSLVGNQVVSVSAQGSLTVRQTCRAGTKVGTSDPAPACGSGVAQRIKGTPGITGLSLPSVHSDGEVWHLNNFVGSTSDDVDTIDKSVATKNVAVTNRALQ